MKKLIIAMSVIAIAFSSCQKQTNLVSNPVSDNSGDLLQTDAIHYYNGKQVTHQSEINSYNVEGSAVIATDKLSGTLEFYYFDNEAQEVSFLESSPVLQPLYLKLTKAIELRNYAASIGALDQYAATGEVSKEYINYIGNANSRGGYMLLSNVATMASIGLFIPIGGLAVFPAAMDNNAESYNSPAGQGLVFRNPFFGGGSFGIFATAGVVNFPPMWRNIISSAL